MINSLIALLSATPTTAAATTTTTTTPTTAPTTAATTAPTTASTTADPCACPAGFTSWSGSQRGSCYKMSATTATWQAARDACKAMSPCADLVAVDEVGEKDWLKTNFILSCVCNVWLGAKKYGAHWQWQATSEIIIKEDPRNDFQSTEPNDDGDCLVSWQGYGNNWGDISCSHSYKYICEISSAFSSSATTTTSGTCTCPSSFTSRAGSTSGSCYFASNNKRTWDSANSACQVLSPCAQLAAIDESGEHDWLVQTLFPAAGINTDTSVNGIWVSGKKINSTSFMWVSTGATFTKTDTNIKMQSTEPNGDGDHLIMWKGFTGYAMGDYPGTSKQAYVCEIRTK